MDKAQNAVTIFNKYALEYEGRFMDVSLYENSLSVFCAAIKKKNAELLELACGPGNITKHILSLRPDFRILGTDLAPNMIARAKANNPDAEFKLMDARALNTLTKKFDGIVCGFCLPYLSMEETRQLIGDASKLLQTHGVLYLSTMEDDYSKSGLRKGSNGDEIYMHYYLAKDLSQMLHENGFNEIKLESKESVQTDGTLVTDLIIIAEKI
jgi:ubiquinone/menaquinone biosynthesis C-methylase UbiE